MASNTPKLGGELDALWRQGLKDLQNNLGTAFPQTDRAVTEPGTPLNPTPQMVTDDLGTRTHNQMLDAYAQQGREQEQSQDTGIDR